MILKNNTLREKNKNKKNKKKLSRKLTRRWSRRVGRSLVKYGARMSPTQFTLTPHEIHIKFTFSLHKFTE